MPTKYHSIDAAVARLESREPGRFWIAQERRHGSDAALSGLARERWYVHDTALEEASNGETLDDAVASALSRANKAVTLTGATP